MKFTSSKGVALLIALLVLAAAAVAGCGSSGSSGSSSSPSEGETATSGGGGEAEPTEESESESGEPEYKVLSTAELMKGTGGKPPSESPPGAEGKTVWWISCGQQIPDCAVPANSAATAAKKLGLDFHIADGRLNENGGDLTALKTALAANPDAIIIHGISCPLIAPALQEAKTREIPVMGVEALDCDEGLEEGEEGAELFTAEMKYNENAESGLEYFQSWGNVGASYVIDATQEKAQVIVAEAAEAGLQKALTNAWNATLELCSGCEKIDSFTFVSPDEGPGLAASQQWNTALVQHGSEANAVYAPFDAVIVSSEASSALEKQGLTDKLNSSGGSGGAASLDLVRSGKWTAVSTHSYSWMGWGAIDNINRVLNEEETVPEGIGFVIATKEKNLPPNPEEEFEPGFPWQKEYEEAWAAAG